MKHYLNVCEINGAKVEPVDVVTFGSPCQDMSVAGKREGIKHSEQGDEETTRSGLFYEAVRIIKEMRKATNGEYPKYAVWENVPGAFSSNKGWDFLAVLEALCSVCDNTVSIPRPYDPKRPNQLVWLGAGEIVGSNYSVAWRTLDAQYWGVPQRRKRIYLVLDLNAQCARKILFKSDGLRGNLPQGIGERQGASHDVVGSADRSAGVKCIAYSFDSLSSNSMKSANPISGCRVAETAKCIDTTYPDPSKNQGGIAIVQPVIALQGNGIDRADTAGCNGCGWREDVMYTLNTIDRPAVCYQKNVGALCATDYKWVQQQQVEQGKIICYGIGNGQADNTDLHEKIGALNCMHDQQACVYEFHQQDGRIKELGDTSETVAAKYGTGGNNTPLVVQSKPPRRYIIRRLIPVECARLQGFPDWWGELASYNPADAEFWESVRKTHAMINGKKYKPVKNIKAWYDKLHNDGAEYKMWGNGIALPNAEYVLHGISERGAKTLGSLFDGSGGFPLAGALNGIRPLWASEIEPYPIAVTVSRFGTEERQKP